MTDYQTVNATIEEPLTGTWVLDLVSLNEPQSGTITILDQAWEGTVISKRQEGAAWYSRIVGGNYALNERTTYRQYKGTVSVQEILMSAIRQAGETVGNIDISENVSQYLRTNETLTHTLNVAADLFNLDWWIDRIGLLNFGMIQGGELDREILLIDSDGDGGATFAVSSFDDIQTRATYEGETIYHIRWLLRENSFDAEVSFKETKIDYAKSREWFGRTFRAQVNTQNTDQTLDVIVNAEFSMGKVPILAAAETYLSGGDLVTVGFYANDPRNPYAVPTDHNRVPDVGSLAFNPGTSGATLLYTPPATPQNPAPVPITVATPPSSTPVKGVIQ